MKYLIAIPFLLILTIGCNNGEIQQLREELEVCQRAKIKAEEEANQQRKIAEQQRQEAEKQRVLANEALAKSHSRN